MLRKITQHPMPLETNLEQLGVIWLLTTACVV